VKYIIPEVFIEKINGEYVVTVNEDSVPHLRVSKIYRKLLDNKNAPEYKFIKEKSQSALWIIKSIQQRMTTIKRVVESILEYQMDFFEYDTDLIPMNLKQIAEATNLHESTVSRAIKGKYVQTPKGVFEIKNFFVRGIQLKNGEDIATDRVKERIKEIINNENSSKPYSDQKLSEILNSQGMNISRRTVTKYREELNIQTSSKRKR
jgi:RNA polymerase sigma-54 factor